MSPGVEQKYLWALAANCKAAKLSYERIRQNLGDAEAVIADAQHFLSDAARISRVLWPTKREQAARGEHLRKILKIPTSSALKSREARNHFEHMDERLDDWAETSTDSDLAMNIVGDRDDYSHINDDDIVGLFNPGHDLLIFYGDQYELNPIYEAICKLDDEVLERLAKQ